MLKILLIISLFAFGAAVHGDAKKKKYCTKEVAGSIKGQKAECKKMNATALKAAGNDKEKRKEAANALKECQKQAEASGATMMNSCMTAEGN